MATALSPLERLAAVGAALDAVADAAVLADTDMLGNCESGLAAAIASMPTADDLSGADIDVVRSRLRRIKHSLERCRAIGSATSELINVTLSAQGMTHGYLPAGVGVPAPRLGRLEARA